MPLAREEAEVVAPRLVIIVTLFLGVTCTAAAAWTPPIGIPDPGWGIVTATPALPSPWTGVVPPFYYVDFSNAAATDTPDGTEPVDANASRYGSPTVPRVTIPPRVPAGGVVYLAAGQNYDQNHRSPYAIIAAGTAARPVFIASSATSKASPRCGWEFAGTYLIVENVHFKPRCPGGTDGVPIIEDQTSAGGTGSSDHIAFRNSEHEGQNGPYPSGNNGQIGGNIVFATKVTNVVIYNDLCHHNGRYLLTDASDDDIDCWTISDYSQSIWVVDSTFYTNSSCLYEWQLRCAGERQRHCQYSPRLRRTYGLSSTMSTTATGASGFRPIPAGQERISTSSATSFTTCIQVRPKLSLFE